jgi:hypothetical protein
MAITEQTQYNTYNPDGVVVTFAYTFCCFDEAELKVYADDVLIADSEYTVTGIGTRTGGNVVFTTAPAASVAELLIKLVPNLDRENEYQQSGELLSETLDNDIDRLYSILQYQDSVQSRTLTFADTTATGMEIVGDSADRANKLLGFDGSGDPALIVPADLSPVTTITAFAETLLDDATSAQARATLETVKNNREQEGIRYATAGTAPNYTLTTASPAVAAYVTGQRFTVVCHSTGTTGSNDINVNALGAKNLKQYDAAGNKRSGVMVSGQVAIIEYDGTDFVILNPLPMMPLTNVRQTVQGGPITSAGLPDFLPATDADLTLTTQNITSNVPFVVCASQGFGLGSDRIATATANFTWTVTNNATNYLYVDVGTDGTFTTGVTTVAPAFQNGGTAATTNGLHTYDYRRMVMYVGDGSATSATWRVIVGEAVASGGAVTSTVAYAYNGYYESTPAVISLSTITTFNCNIGAPFDVSGKLICKTAEYGYRIGDEVDALLWYAGSYTGGNTFARNNATDGNWKKCGISMSAYLTLIFDVAANDTVRTLTSANWNTQLICKRKF